MYKSTNKIKPSGGEIVSRSGAIMILVMITAITPIKVLITKSINLKVKTNNYSSDGGCGSVIPMTFSSASFLFVSGW